MNHYFMGSSIKKTWETPSYTQQFNNIHFGISRTSLKCNSDISRISSQVKIGNEWLICFLNVAVCIRRRKKKTLEIWNRLKGNGDFLLDTLSIVSRSISRVMAQVMTMIIFFIQWITGRVNLYQRTDGRYSTHYRKNKHFNKANNQLTHGSVKLKWNHQTQTNKIVPSLL